MGFAARLINLKTGGIGNWLPAGYAVKPSRQAPSPLGFSELQVQLPLQLASLIGVMPLLLQPRP
jgi:hypothetical protein